MKTFDMTLHAADQWQLAEHLRTVADRIVKAGPDCLPDAGEEKALVFDGAGGDGMNTFDLTLHAADQWQLAEHLRTVADRIAKAGPDCLPEPGEEKALVFDGVEIGTIAQPVLALGRWWNEDL